MNLAQLNRTIQVCEELIKKGRAGIADYELYIESVRKLQGLKQVVTVAVSHPEAALGHRLPTRRL